MFMNGSNITKIFIFGPLEMELLMVCTSIFVSLITTILDTSMVRDYLGYKIQPILEQDLISNSQQIGINLSTHFFLPFELISINLLIALIGAITVASQY
ncbi:hypothetical protein RHMOL_Rhmol02G0168100 [Rhododendron molle]|uniref:Uncharacterized protein n=1 Tax=Rhododendron molle TaxID=49168 RepID=A0ACC0PRD7_RHOML|nr:hypothetical protein RHMOL_Rhmol02G0168100 [Rhododendron molle]